MSQTAERARHGRRRRAAETAAARDVDSRSLTNPFPVMDVVSAVELEAIHAAALAVLEDPGVGVLLPEARALCRAAGAAADDAGQMVRIGREVVTAALAAITHARLAAPGSAGLLRHLHVECRHEAGRGGRRAGRPGDAVRALGLPACGRDGGDPRSRLARRRPDEVLREARRRHGSRANAGRNAPGDGGRGGCERARGAGRGFTRRAFLRRRSDHGARPDRVRCAAREPR